MRWALGGLLAAGGLTAIFCLGWGLPSTAPAPAAGNASWQMRELTFLKAAYDRLQQDGKGETESKASLRREQQQIVGQMADTAKLMPDEAVPAELRPLLQAAAAMPVPPPQRSKREAAGSGISEARLLERRTPDLRSGLPIGVAGAPRPVMQPSDFTTAPELREAVRTESILAGPIQAGPIQAGPIEVGPRQAGPNRAAPAAEPTSRRKSHGDTARSRRGRGRDNPRPR